MIPKEIKYNLHYHDVRRQVQTWNTPLQIYNRSTPSSTEKINTIKKCMNSHRIPSSHHYGTTDPDCHFHGNHLHLRVQLSTREKHIQHNYAYKTPVSSQKIRSPAQFTTYMLKSPKTYLSTSSDEIRLIQTPSHGDNVVEDEQQPSTSGVNIQ